MAIARRVPQADALMATLVLSTVGNALGGPVGGAIGAMIGQSFDQQLLSPASRGPRVGDLTVQTSSYGTQVPRIYGSMRVAGSIVWATEVVESEETAGAKGQPNAVYSYSVSLAVALSSRPAGAIGRIWADGKLLRGAEGDFKVPTGFRFYDGSEDQAIDPLIGSIEGISNTPAYRGLALAVFENLELAEFGNRIPFMTFEVIADAEPPTISAILADASNGAIAARVEQSLVGFAAYGRSIAEAVRPLVDCFDVTLFDDGSGLRAPDEQAPIAISPEELGSSADGRKAAIAERDQLAVRGVPATLRLTYYDPARDYQSGEARAIAGELSGNDAQQQLPAVLSADGAKTLAEQMLAREWAARDRLILRLPPPRTALAPGTIIQPGVAAGWWRVEKSTIDGFVNVVELRPLLEPIATIAGDPGRIVPSKDVVQGPATLLLIDAANPWEGVASGPSVLIAASSSSAGWSTRPLTVSGSGEVFTTQSAATKSILGRAISLLADAEPFLIDETNSVDIEMVDPEQWLTSCDDDALANGANLAVLGSELVQFGTVVPLSEGRFRLSRLLRGRGGSEWGTAAHAVGESFCILDPSSLRALPLPQWLRGATVSATGRDAAQSSITFNAEAVRPLSPIGLSAAIDASGNLVVQWVRRSRSGFAWVDEIDVPIGESREQYRVSITAGETTVEYESKLPSLTVAASDLASLGGGGAIVEVRQLGDWAASRAAQLSIDLT
jgi:hypothetical protein